MTATSWSVLLVDEDPQTHVKLTKAFGGITIDGKAVRINSALNTEHARLLLEHDGPYELMIIGTEADSLRNQISLVHWLREEQTDSRTQVVLATNGSEEMVSRQVQRLELEGVSTYERDQFYADLPIAHMSEGLNKQAELIARWRQTDMAKKLFSANCQEECMEETLTNLDGERRA